MNTETYEMKENGEGGISLLAKAMELEAWSKRKQAQLRGELPRCKDCFRQFMPTRSDQKFCCRACGQRYRRHMAKLDGTAPWR